ncbi:hypothetical protein Nepgr_023376 [Nepenthes gracilis]|uniref:DUF7950 domain-containing protein n=1 Tax=Nepenthes gracilis TaxID=150966 RepID=A0AAD3T2Q1_NEPGR|nr:hypothetical protein Nepgr_023376 [Nepenthes gracilis]
MNGRGGCCIARYGGGAAACDLSNFDRIMLRFRPIAPKPVAGGGFSGPSKEENNDRHLKTGRGKRRYAKDNHNNNGRRGRGSGARKRKSSYPEGKSSDGDGLQNSKPVVTLPLLPETPDLTAVTKRDRKAPSWLRFSSLVRQNDADGHARSGSAATVCFTGGDRTAVRMPPQQQQEDEERDGAAAPARVTVGSYVIVECVTDTWVDGDWLGRTDEEKRRRLEEDTCPGFISDGWNRVWWTNKAYRKMTMRTAGGGEAENVVVWLVMRETLPPTCPACTCWVRVLNRRHWKEGGSSSPPSSSPSLTLPCDVWRMDSGEFAWRLDVAASLSLGR